MMMLGRDGALAVGAAQTKWDVANKEQKKTAEPLNAIEQKLFLIILG
jgi:hypothetical protein